MGDMSRDHRKLRVFHDAHALTLAIYKETNGFPKDEWFGLRMQMRRAALSVPSNIVEGSARRSAREYCNFLNIATGSACELAYLLHVADALHLLSQEPGARLQIQADRVVRQMKRLVGEVEVRTRQDSNHASPTARQSGKLAPRTQSREPKAESPKSKAQGPKPKDNLP